MGGTLTAAALADAYRGRNCLVTGHTGFKGAWLCLLLERLGARVTGYALDPPTRPNLFGMAGLDGLAGDVRGDVRDIRRLSEAVAGCAPEYVFHLAAQPIVRHSYARPKETLDTNIGGTTNLLESLRTCPTLRAAVVVTSDKCYEHPIGAAPHAETDPLGGHDPYSASKAAAEIVASAYARSFFLPQLGVATARAGNVIGGGDWAADRILPDAVRALAEGRPLAVRNPGFTRPWQHVLDPLCGYLCLGAALAADPSLSGPWNFGPPPEACRTVGELASLFFAAYGAGSWEDHSSRQTGAPHETDVLLLDATRAQQGLGWRTLLGFEESVERAARWYHGWMRQVPARDLCAADMEDYLNRLR